MENGKSSSGLLRNRSRVFEAASLVILLASVACDKDEKPAAGSTADGAAPATSATTPATPSASATGAASASAAGPSDAGHDASVAMPERPIPRPQTTVGAGMPTDVQMKAIAYMMAMRTPHPDDANADPKFAEDLATKLKPIVLGMDKGADRAKFNRVEIVANGRQIDLLMSQGCDAQAPKNAVATRANVPLATLRSNGVLVIRCNDQHHQCLQSTRDPDDVLCTTAPRHK